MYKNELIGLPESDKQIRIWLLVFFGNSAQTLPKNLRCLATPQPCFSHLVILLRGLWG